jgi:hypothetical protein
MKKTSQSNIKTSTSKKKPVLKEKTIYDESFTSPYYEYKDMYTRQLIKTNREWALLAARELIDYAKTPEARRINTFWNRKGVSYEVSKTLCGIYEELFDAEVIAKDIIGDKRLNKGLEKEWDSGMVMFVQHQYHPDWKEANEYHDERKKAIAKEEGVNGNKEYIVLEKCVDCKEVPTKKEENE